MKEEKRRDEVGPLLLYIRCHRKVWEQDTPGAST